MQIVSEKLNYSPGKSPIMHVWEALDPRIWQRVSVPANIQQLRIAIEEEWTNISQSITWSTLCEGDVLHCVRQIVVTPDTDWFSDHPDPPNTVKLHILEWSFICGQPKAHLCNNHAVYSVSWNATPVRGMDYIGKEVLTNTDLDRFVNNIWEKKAFCVHTKSLRSLSSAHENGGKNKSVVFIILFSVYIYIYIYILGMGILSKSNIR